MKVPEQPNSATMKQSLSQLARSARAQALAQHTGPPPPPPPQTLQPADGKAQEQQHTPVLQPGSRTAPQQPQQSLAAKPSGSSQVQPGGCGLQQLQQARHTLGSAIIALEVCTPHFWLAVARFLRAPSIALITVEFRRPRSPQISADLERVLHAGRPVCSRVLGQHHQGERRAPERDVHLPAEAAQAQCAASRQVLFVIDALPCSSAQRLVLMSSEKFRWTAQSNTVSGLRLQAGTKNRAAIYVVC